MSRIRGLRAACFNKYQVEDFSHEPLNIEEPTIRVLRIQPGCRRSVVKCELKHQKLIDNGHVCLSYMWGDASHLRSILVNGCRMLVRANLWLFLHTARRMKIGGWLWIDAISIDQDNIPERNHQVQQMAQIYKLARHVLIWPEPLYRTASRGVEE